MTGNNELHLNGATMSEAVQYWLTNQVLNAQKTSPVVERVTYNSSMATFIVELKSETENSK